MNNPTNSKIVAMIGGRIQFQRPAMMALYWRAHWIMLPSDTRFAGERPSTARLDSYAMAESVAFMKLDSDHVSA